MAKSDWNTKVSNSSGNCDLFGEIKLLIELARKDVADAVNRSLTHLNWNIGRLIHHHILQGNRAEYGKEILAIVS